jgi:hypothetical protein
MNDNDWLKVSVANRMAVIREYLIDGPIIIIVLGVSGIFVSPTIDALRDHLCASPVNNI